MFQTGRGEALGAMGREARHGEAVDRSGNIMGRPVLLRVVPAITPVEHAEDAVRDPLDLGRVQCVGATGV